MPPRPDMYTLMYITFYKSDSIILGRGDLNQDKKTMSPERRGKHHNLISEGNSMDILAL